MLYSHLTNEELERWCYCSPADLLAKAEMLRRVPHILYVKDEEHLAAEDIARQAEARVSELDADLEKANEEIGALEQRIERAGDIINRISLVAAEGAAL